ncbi:MAG TPA: patatin-like phospholipase family protein [Hymenobacter sp.]|uniref:patatin-like phospholipase family protein n=1 Tax=Hymenobacter sp. TaxID=1898978 RepID=UPI002D7FB377|nr:patatin-like phospholipase family protein [Hymenobacter sp.]HET9504027.1 patatin-like phospholipase family protein [Hymenobacter sp.]
MRLLFLLTLLTLLNNPQPASAQTSPYRNLIMKGGGIRGIAYGGALQELESRGVLAHITRVGGTSAGAIQAALLAVGYSPDAIIDIINRTPVQRLNDGQFIFIGGGSRLLRQYGWYRGDQLTKYICELVGRQTQRPNLTLAELHQLALAQPGHYRDLYTTGTNLTLQRTQVFGYETHPTMRVADAVRISMSIPLYFRAVLLDADNKVIQGKPKAGQPTQVLVDGGLLANYPLHIFDQSQFLPAGLPPGTTANPETLGLRLDRAEQIALDTLPTGRQALAPYDIHDFSSYIGALYTISLENLNPALPGDWPRTISINTMGFRPKVKRISDEQKAQLIASGRAGVQAFFEKN